MATQFNPLSPPDNARYARSRPITFRFTGAGRLTTPSFVKLNGQTIAELADATITNYSNDYVVSVAGPFFDHVSGATDGYDYTVTPLAGWPVEDNVLQISGELAATPYTQTRNFPTLDTGYVPDQTQVAQDRLIEQFQGDPLLNAWVASYLAQVQDLEDTIDQLLNQRSLDNATGESLRRLGEIVNLLQDGEEDDEVYRLLLRAEIAILNSEGHADDLMALLALLVGQTTQNIKYDEYFPKTVYLFPRDTDADAGVLDDPFGFTDQDLILRLLKRAAPGGTEVHYVYNVTQASDADVFHFSTVADTNQTSQTYGTENGDLAGAAGPDEPKVTFPENQTPLHWLEWSTHSSAVTADPGGALRSAAWAVGDAPAASHVNYMLNGVMGYASFPAQANPSLMAYGGIDYRPSEVEGPWGVASSVFFCVYRPEVNRWYALRVRTTGSTADIYDSEDGESTALGGTGWEGSLNLFGSAVTDTDITLPIIGHKNQLVFGIHNRVFESTDSTVRNLDGGTTPFAELARVREMVYDPVNAIYVAVGSNGSGDGKIETSPDLVTWTVQHTTVADEFESLCVDPDGNFFASTDNNSTNRYSSDGVTWDASGALASAVYRCWYDPHSDLMLFVDSTNDLRRSSNAGSTWSNTGLEVSTWWTTPEFNWFRDPTTEALTEIGHYFASTLDFTNRDLGFMHIGVEVAVRYGWFQGGQGKLMWPWSGTGATAEHAITYYGAQSG